MILSLVAVQAQVFLQLAVFSTFEVRLTGARWVAQTAADLASAVFAVPPAQRSAVVRRFGDGLPAQVGWGTARPNWAGDQGSPVTARLTATLRERLGPEARAFEVTLVPLDYEFPVRKLRIGVVPDDVAGQFGGSPIGADEPDMPIPASVRVAVQGQDGSWISVAPVSFVASGIISGTPLVPLAGGGLIVALISALTARRIMAPLNRLLRTAQRVGSSREVIAVADEGLGEFAPVAQAFEDMQRRLLRLVDDRTQMLAAISHDLRSALTRLRIAAEECEGERERQAIVREIEDMQAMVESTLTFASGEARMTPSRSTDVAALLISLVDEAADSGRRCTYVGPDHAEVMAHPVALKRAFSNLMDNAVKYGGAARVTLVAGSERLLVCIEDDGPGIPADRAEEAFAPFRRLDPARSHDVPGVGLGLTIARDVVRSHGGTIMLDTAPGGGFVVTVGLPAGTPANPLGAGATASSVGAEMPW